MLNTAVNMTCIAQKLKTVHYKTHAVGKWDVGMATPRHTPSGEFLFLDYVTKYCTCFNINI